MDVLIVNGALVQPPAMLDVFRLGGSSKPSTLVLDDPLVGEICTAEIVTGLKRSFSFFLDLSADLQIPSMGRD